MVAVIDDDAGVLDSLKFLLETAGHTVSVYKSAIDFLEQRTTKPACLILDHHMPDMTGLDLVDKLCREHSEIPVLLITSAPTPAIIVRASRLGVESVLEKPPTAADILGFASRHS
jgi:FixJ family two-component response regulator